MIPRIQFHDDAIQVDAAIIAEILGIEPSLLQKRLRRGEVTSLCERGIDEDSGRFRLTFFAGSKRIRFIVDASGNVIKRSVINFSGRPLPRSLRTPGL